MRHSHYRTYPHAHTHKHKHKHAHIHAVILLHAYICSAWVDQDGAARAAAEATAAGTGAGTGDGPNFNANQEITDINERINALQYFLKAAKAGSDGLGT